MTIANSILSYFEVFLSTEIDIDSSTWYNLFTNATNQQTCFVLQNWVIGLVFRVSTVIKLSIVRLIK